MRYAGKNYAPWGHSEYKGIYITLARLCNQVWEIFTNVVKRKGIFGSISMDEAYRISLYDKYEQEMTGHQVLQNI